MVHVESVQGPLFPETLLKAWELLLTRSAVGNPYVTPLWTLTWLKHFGATLRSKILLSRSPTGELAGLGAFLETNGEEGPGAVLLGSEDVWDYRDLVIARDAEKEVFADFAEYFSASPWKFIELPSISEVSPTYGRFLPFLRDRGFQVSEEKMEPCIYVNLPPTWDDFLGTLNSKDRHELRRKLRRLERDSSFQVEERSQSADPATLERFFTLHTLSKSEKAEFMTNGMKAYFLELAARFQEKKWLDLSFLRIEGKDAAALLSFVFGETEYLYNSGYDPQFGRYSPGIILNAQQIGRAIQKGLKTFNFLKGREDYKFRLGGREEELYRLRVAPR
jgi:hypothetical protein